MSNNDIHVYPDGEPGTPEYEPGRIIRAPRMTPTNDAPVTVEQCDRDAAADLMIAINASDGLAREVDPWRTGAYDKRHLVRAFARHRLAALASAPAGDGVKVQRDAMAEFETWWSDHKAGGGEWVKRAAFVAGWAAALARPRAAVGEQSREAIAAIIAPNAFKSLEDITAEWTAWADHEHPSNATVRTVIPASAQEEYDKNEPARLRALKKADAILALQSPPAKVEG